MAYYYVIYVSHGVLFTIRQLNGARYIISHVVVLLYNKQVLLYNRHAGIQYNNCDAGCN